MYKYNFLYKYITHTSHIHHASHTHTHTHHTHTHTHTPSVELEYFWIYKLKLQTLLPFCRNKGWEVEDVQSNGKQTRFMKPGLHVRTSTGLQLHFTVCQFYHHHHSEYRHYCHPE